MWFRSSPVGIAHHSAKSSRVWIAGCGFFIIRLTDVLVRVMSLWRLCFAAFAFSSRHWNTSFRAWSTKSEWWPPEDLIFSTLVEDPPSLFLGVWSLHSRSCQAGKCGQRSGSGDTSSQSWNLIRRQDVVQFLPQSAFYLHQGDYSLQSQKHCLKPGHSPIHPVCPKQYAFSRLPRRSL